MIGVLRLGFIGFVVLTVIYFIVTLYSRSVRRGKLEREFDQDIQTGDRDEFIRAGLKDYEGSFRRKLILGIYVVPILLVVGLIYVMNFM